jgi:hypothetical protein
VDSAKFANEAHFMSFAAIIVPEMGQRARIEINDTEFVDTDIFIYLVIYLFIEFCRYC